MEGGISIILSRFRHHHDPYLGSSLEIHILNLLSCAGFDSTLGDGTSAWPKIENGWNLIKIEEKKEEWISQQINVSLFCFCFIFFLGGGKVEFCRHYKSSPQTSAITEEVYYYHFNSFVNVFIFIP